MKNKTYKILNRNDRIEKQENQVFHEEREPKKLRREFKPKTQHQIDFVRTVAESDVTICYGPSGTGKSYGAVGLACEHLLDEKIDRVLLCRSIIGCGDTIGALPGSIDERISPYMLPYIEYFEHFLGNQFLSYFRQDKIKLIPVELLRGHTYNDSIIILDETQNCTPKQTKLFLTRLGQNSKAIILGDNKQSDIHNNGLQFLIDKMVDIPKLNIVQYDNSDIMRHPIIGEIINVFDSNGI